MARPFTDVRTDTIGMLPIEGVCPDRNQERRAVHERHRDTERDDAVLRDPGPGRDDHHSQEPEEGSGGDRDAESRLVLGAAVELVQPLDAVVDESQRDAPENAAGGIELTDRPVDSVGCPGAQARDDLADARARDGSGLKANRNGQRITQIIVRVRRRGRVAARWRDLGGWTALSRHRPSGSNRSVE